ncbi:GLPGLI family protein [Tenacibaculum sp. HL-MS23]|uniref:GLPGLI family protein n=1 Tax=Tenacibaculum TaxID=104267 RepID=UPI0023AF06DB|nr:MULTISPECIES: GLPGLI family protein [Tenacibaculum]WNW01036.1 GLPGLI family protein [Tenacibaculum sp. HL-MS23]
MKKIITMILCVIIYQSSFSQVHRIIYAAEYSFPDMEKTSKEVSSRFKEKIKLLKKNNDNLSCFLDFDKNMSVFYVDNKMNSEGRKKRNITEIKVGKGTFFTDNIKSEIINHKNSFGSDFEVVYPQSIWSIAQQTKKIGKFICYKATTEVVQKGRWGEKTIPVIAWFTTDLPYRFGPKQYSGLPGVILELTEGSLTFYAQKIKLNQISLKLKEREGGGQRVTKKEFDDISKKVFENR